MFLSLSLSLLTWYSSIFRTNCPSKVLHNIYTFLTAFYTLILKDSQFNLKVTMLKLLKVDIVDKSVS